MNPAQTGLNPETITELELFAEAQVPLELGSFSIQVYRCLDDGTEHLAIAKGDLAGEIPPFVRVHSECFTGEVLGSLRCDCKGQLDSALRLIAAEGRGLIIYLRNHEGRGIGLGNKIRAYRLQDEEGLDTLNANRALGFPDDMRNFSAAVAILRALNISKVRLNTNNPTKIEALQNKGIQVTELIPALSPPNPHNIDYLHTKFAKLGHHLGALFEEIPKVASPPR